jgi:hypothetical protein
MLSPVKNLDWLVNCSLEGKLTRNGLKSHCEHPSETVAMAVPPSVMDCALGLSHAPKNGVRIPDLLPTEASLTLKERVEVTVFKVRCGGFIFVFSFWPLAERAAASPLTSTSTP